ncbi:TPA: methyl-accepting chemotaxis protein [Vibrio parahaemolyticus]
MSIKQSIAALVILLSVSFSASAYYWKHQGSDKTFATPSEVDAWVKDTWNDTVPNNEPDYIKYYNCYFSYSGNTGLGKCNETGTSRISNVASFYRYDGPPPSPYCERQSTLDAIDSARTQCESQGKQFSYSCSDETESWDSQCNGDSCEDLKAKDAPSPGVIPDDGQSSAATRYYCDVSTMCEAKQSYFVSGGDLYKESYYTGNKCVGSSDDYTNDPYYPPITEPDPDPDEPIHKPDDPTGGDIEDPSVLPDSDNDVVVPEPPTDEPDVEDPPTDESTDTAVVNAITGMNKDVNKALNDMNIDINQASADVQNQIIALNASVVTNTQAIQKQQANDNEIYRKTKSLIQQANADITTAVNKNTNAINGVGDDVEKIAGAMDGIAEDVAGISDTLDGIANTDTSGAGIGGTCIEAGTCTGFYESKYPEGLGGLVSGQLNDLKVNTIDNFVSSFGNLDLSNAQRPSFVLPVPFFGDFSFEEHISFDWVFGFVRSVLIMTSIFAARRIIFGG